MWQCFKFPFSAGTKTFGLKNHFSKLHITVTNPRVGGHDLCRDLTACVFRPMSSNMTPYLTTCKMTTCIGHYPAWDDFCLCPHFLLFTIHFNIISSVVFAWLIDVASLIFLSHVQVQRCVEACRDAVIAACNFLASHKPTYSGDGFSRDGVPYFRISQKSGSCVFFLKGHIQGHLIQDHSLSL